MIINFSHVMDITSDGKTVHIWRCPECRGAVVVPAWENREDALGRHVAWHERLAATATVATL